MFETLGSFSVFFFSVATLLLLGIIFEEQCLALEEKIDNKLKTRKEKRK